MERVDLHSHYLPGLDDGAGSLAETVEILRHAHADGTRTMVATPHMFLPPAERGDLLAVQDRFAEVVARLVEMAGREETAFLGRMSFALGAENFVSAAFLEALERGQILTLDGGRHLLVEFSPYLAFAAIESVLDRVLGAGLVPVLAHVERYPCLCEHPRRLERLVAAGCLCQINAATLLGAQGRRARRRCFELLRRDLAQLVASDAHDTTRRPPCLGAAAEVLARRFGGERARRWTCENPLLLLPSVGARGGSGAQGIEGSEYRC